MKKSGQKGKREGSDAENTTVAKRTREEGAEAPSYGIPVCVLVSGFLLVNLLSLAWVRFFSDKVVCPVWVLGAMLQHADGIVEVVKPSFHLPSKLLMNCVYLRNVGLVLKQECDGLDHVCGLGFRYQYLEQDIADIPDFLQHLGQSNRTSPVRVICRPPVGVVALDLNKTPKKSDLAARYRRFAPSSMTTKSAIRVQEPKDSEKGPLY